MRDVEGQQPDISSFTFADAAGLRQEIALTIDSTRLKPAGFAPGDMTGSIGITAGSHRFNVTSAEADAVTIMVPMAPNSSTTVIAYCTLIVDPKTKKPKKSVQLWPRPNPKKDSGRHFQLVYVSGRPEIDISLNGTPTKLKSMREMGGASLSGGAIRVDYANKTIVNFVAPQAGNFLVVLYDGEAGSVAGLVLPDYH